MLCPGCGDENREARHYCGQCGSKLGWTCGACHFFNYARESYCGGCGSVGAALDAPQVERTAVAKATSEQAVRAPPSPTPNMATRNNIIAQEISSALKELQTKDDHKRSVSQDDIDQLFGKG